MPDDRASSVFRPASARTLRLIAQHNRDRRCNFLMASNYVNATAAQLGYVLSDLAPVGPAGPRVSYLLSSGLEALSAAIKLARHTAVRDGRDSGGWVLLLDPRGRYQEFMDPVRAGLDEALIPHVAWAPTAAEAARRFPGTTWTGVLIVREDDTDLTDPALGDLLAACRRASGLVALCATETELTGTELTGTAVFANPIDADVMVFGENLADRQVPFGALTMSPRAHRVWRNHVDCFAHTSTYGGNVLCAAIVLDALERAGCLTDRHRAVLAAIDADPAVTVDYWGRHINPNIAAMAKVFNLNVDVRRASGGRFTTGDGRDVIDCAGGFGSNLRGHNPPDLVPEVLDRHDPGHDYAADLEGVLAELTGLPHAFPSVSGAVANHVAVSLAALARPQRRTVVSFKGNYGGKTLFSLNLSKYGPQRTESVEDAFRPYYHRLVHLDPFAAGAADRFREVVADGDVALVWFELIQGATCRPLPDALVRVIDEGREAGGYLVGVDEVLTGGWRSGAGYLAHHDRMRPADIVSLGKTISDMTMPAASVVVSEPVYRDAVATDPEHVAVLRTRLRHNLGAHISLHALRSLDAGTVAEFQQAYAELRANLDAVCQDSPVLGPVAGRAAHMRLTMEHRLLSFPHGSTPGTLLTLALADLIFQRSNVYVPLLAIRHRVAADPADLKTLAERIAAGTRGITPLMVYRHAAGRILGQKFPWLGRRLSGRGPTSQVPDPRPATSLTGS
ncbi:aminotransferase class III-fold pyridoxal phosphate-dependent enzyme [Paractinoplanes rishiriensis]|uniref:Aminotransferase n=1 Tax=Paractinoplanes rishiriensis TaxID=1050105 RepID=A0A919JTL8_9ACTN|nr:aminotransferase class III-fold pyridoxal phosphate-dependent enzyme [Actinoplanes rishiriensis]GIE92958.1 putative aminotransferase [Actinoplanes rishiriensis]